ncbi:MAG: hypothetical protein ETSY1_14010 [Candidatus Entotheonella factor]|uniref:4Fe-4S ferredoxin-type domain-containing protein n=1 Tax=Entotheonella factor TaxID=1429438 RepID=W4LQM8_ENTF1|nr:MAG: hypothetical protein ETSY1_14010 [Candidatus Entotheonella factor]
MCPVECFYDAGSQVVINPDECILCDICVYECPVNWWESDRMAIGLAHELPADKQSFIEFNATQSQSSPRVQWG